MKAPAVIQAWCEPAQAWTELDMTAGWAVCLECDAAVCCDHCGQRYRPGHRCDAPAMRGHHEPEPLLPRWAVGGETHA